MIFKRLRLKNFKSYANEVINFDKGITVIIGQNGAGKSSILVLHYINNILQENYMIWFVIILKI